MPQRSVSTSVQRTFFEELGGFDERYFMFYEDVDLGAPGEDMLRIKIEAAAINFFDALMIGGTYQTKPEFPFTPGGEVGGTVLSAPESSAWMWPRYMT